MIQDWGSASSWGIPLPSRAWDRHPLSGLYTWVSKQVFNIFVCSQAQDFSAQALLKSIQFLALSYTLASIPAPAGEWHWTPHLNSRVIQLQFPLSSLSPSLWAYWNFFSCFELNYGLKLWKGIIFSFFFLKLSFSFEVVDSCAVVRPNMERSHIPFPHFPHRGNFLQNYCTIS